MILISRDFPPGEAVPPPPSPVWPSQAELSHTAIAVTTLLRQERDLLYVQRCSGITGLLLGYSGVKCHTGHVPCKKGHRVQDHVSQSHG